MSKRGAGEDPLKGERDGSRIKVVLVDQAGDDDEVEFIDRANGEAIDAAILLAIFPAEVMLRILFGSPEPHRVLRAFERHGPIARDYVVHNRLWAILFAQNYPLQWQLSHSAEGDIRANLGGDMKWDFRQRLDSISDNPGRIHTYWKRYYELMELPPPSAVTNARARPGGYVHRGELELVYYEQYDTIISSKEIDMAHFDPRIITNAEGRLWWANSGMTLHTSSQVNAGAHIVYLSAASFFRVVPHGEAPDPGPNTPHATHMMEIDFNAGLHRMQYQPISIIPYDETLLGVPLAPMHRTGGWDIRSPDGFSWAVVTMRTYRSKLFQILNQRMAKTHGSFPQGVQLVSSELIDCVSCGHNGRCQRCKRCRKVHYCSKVCQRKHWNSHHKYMCRK